MNNTGLCGTVVPLSTGSTYLEYVTNTAVGTDCPTVSPTSPTAAGVRG